MKELPIELRQLPLADAGVDQERSIEVRLTRVPRVDWPEHPGSDGILMLDDQQTSHAIPENKR
jgi:hypothetical protein